MKWSKMNKIQKFFTVVLAITIIPPLVVAILSKMVPSTLVPFLPGIILMSLVIIGIVVYTAVKQD